MAHVRSDGALQRSKVSRGEQNDILEALQEKGATVASVAKSFGRNETTILLIQRKFRPTTTLAKAIIRSKAAEMVERVLDKGEVDHLIDVLSRPNIGVLDAPAGKGGGGSMGVGIMVSVGTGSLAAISSEVVESIPQDTAPQTAELSMGAKTVKVGSIAMGEVSRSPVERRVATIPGIPE
jgi:transposase-like protein